MYTDPQQQREYMRDYRASKRAGIPFVSPAKAAGSRMCELCVARIPNREAVTRIPSRDADYVCQDHAEMFWFEAVTHAAGFAIRARLMALEDNEEFDEIAQRHQRAIAFAGPCPTENVPKVAAA